MSKLMDKLTRAPTALKKAYKKLETEALAAEGRRSLEKKKAVARAVTKRAAKAALMAGAMAAASVVVREIRKRGAPG